MDNLLLLLITLAAISYWWFGAQGRERAIVEAKRLCALDGLQFLDQTVQQQKQWVTRGKQGFLCYCRLYTFEFTKTGEERYQGRILIVAGNIVKSDLDAYRID